MRGEVLDAEQAAELAESAVIRSAMMLAAGDRLADVAAQLGVSDRTVMRWRKTEDWQRAYKAAQSEIINRARGRLVALTETALNRIEDHLREEDPDRARKMASQAETAWKVLKHAGVEIEVSAQEAPKRIVTRLPQAGSATAPVVVNQADTVAVVVAEDAPASGQIREVRRGW